MPQWKGIVGTGYNASQFETYVRGLHFDLWRPQFVVLHNTSAPRLSQWHSTPGHQRMLNLEHFYRDEQKWSAGPHLFVADDLIWVFTPLTTSGRHSPSWNLISWGVEMVGEYQVEPFGDAVRNNTVAALTTMHALMGLDPATLRFHKEDPATTHKSCPGKNVKKTDIIQRVTAALQARAGEEHPVGGGPA